MAETKKTPNPIDVHVGARVRLKRTMLGLSQEKLGDSLGVSFQQVQKYEKGSNRISASKMHEIAEILQESVSFFFKDSPGATSQQTGFGEAENSEYIADLLSSPDDVKLFRAFNKIKDPKIRKNIIDMVRSFADGE